MLFRSAEEISIDVQGVRERVLRIGRLPIAVKNGDDVAAEVCTRWLIGASPEPLPLCKCKELLIVSQLN